MGFLNRLFTGKSKEDEEVELIFKKIDLLLNSDDVQTNMLSPVLRSKLKTMPLKSIVDEFGRNPRNPIPCNGPLGELTYLSKLVISTNLNNSEKQLIPITFHRLGSIENSIDKYEIISYDGLIYDVLYFDMYFKNKSKQLPIGYSFEESVTGLRGTNMFNKDFPYNQDILASECAQRILSFPAYDTKLKNIDVNQAVKIINLVKNQNFTVKIDWWTN